MNASFVRWGALEKLNFWLFETQHVSLYSETSVFRFWNTTFK